MTRSANRRKIVIEEIADQKEPTPLTMAPTLPFKVGERKIECRVFGGLTRSQLNNPELFRDQALSGGNWIEAKSGKRFDVTGRYIHPFYAGGD